MWWRVVFFALAIGLSSALAWPAPATPPRITQNVQRPVVIATLPCDSNLQSTSSGIVIDDELVVTVAHAIYESRDFAVRDSTGRWHDAAVQYMDLDRDLAILRVRSLPASPMAIAVGEAEDPVVLLDGAASGSATGSVLRRVQIRMDALGDGAQEWVRSGYELSLPIKGGDSGAGVVDEDGNLLGLVFARSVRSETASWAIRASEIADIRDSRGAPTWQCERDSHTELILRPLEEPDRLP